MPASLGTSSLYSGTFQLDILILAAGRMPPLKWFKVSLYTMVGKRSSCLRIFSPLDNYGHEIQIGPSLLAVYVIKVEIPWSLGAPGSH